MTNADFQGDYAGIGEMLRGSIGLAAALHQAEKVKATAEAIAPVYTGEYKSVFDIVPGDNAERAEVYVVNNSPHAFDVEFGRGKTPRHRTLGKALGVA